MRFEFLLGIVAASTLPGCSSEGDILPKKERFPRSTFDAGGAEPDGGSDAKKPRDPNANCVPPGTPSNERGVGGYCERADECPDDAGPRFCTAEFTEITVVDDDKWFCSTLCDVDADCGTGAVCVEVAGRRGCSPLACRPDAA